MDDNENEYDGTDVDDAIEIPGYPFVESAALADAMEMGAQIAESAAQFLRGYSLRLMSDHNQKVELEDAMAEAAAEIEQIINGGESDG